MKKIQISQTLKNIIIIIVIAVIFFFIGKVWPSGEEPTEITSDLLSQQIQSISELASVEYNYTNMGKYENQATFYGWKVPFTTKSFIPLSCLLFFSTLHFSYFLYSIASLREGN